VDESGWPVRVGEGKPIEAVGTASDMRATSRPAPGFVVSRLMDRSNSGHDHQIILVVLTHQFLLTLVVGAEVAS
jgi:hypothetical protein